MIPLLLIVLLFWILSGLSAYLLLGQAFNSLNLAWSRSNQGIALSICCAGPAALVASLVTVFSMPQGAVFA